MGFRFVVSGICMGFLCGAIFAASLWSWVGTLDSMMYQLLLGAYGAAIFGLLACGIDLVFWLGTREENDRNEVAIQSDYKK